MIRGEIAVSKLLGFYVYRFKLLRSKNFRITYELLSKL